MSPQEESPTECVGPEYRPDNQKPKATISKEVPHDNIIVLPQTPQLIALLTYEAHLTFTL